MGNQWLIHPSLRGLDLDSAVYISAQRALLEHKKFLRAIYQDFYLLLKSGLPEPCNRVVELGSGAGWIEQVIPQAVKSDVFFQPFANLALNAMQPPFKEGSLDAIVFADVFHHIPDVMLFLQNARFSLRKGGRVVMIEPWFTPWSKMIYSCLHHEPLDWKTGNWKFKSSGPLSGANQALPWIVFHRDKPLFVREFPDLHIIKLQPMMPFRYILSGGVSSWLGMPGFFYTPVKRFEKLFEKNISKWAMFALIILEKVR